MTANSLNYPISGFYSKKVKLKLVSLRNRVHLLVVIYL